MNRSRSVHKIAAMFIVCLSAGLPGCEKPEIVRGPEYELYVFAEKTDWQKLETTLSRVFLREVMTPQDEYHFRLIHVNPDSVGFYLPHKQLLFVSSLESEGEVANIVRRSVNREETLDKIRNSNSFLFRNKDQWGKDQLIVTMVSTTVPKLNDLIDENHDFIYGLFSEHQRNSTKRFMYQRLENVELSRELMQKYKWKVRIQHDYGLALEDSAGKFVFLRRRYPERWLFVKWFDGLEPGQISLEWYFDMRDTIGVRYYGGDKVNRQYTGGKYVNFLGRRCLRIQGLWKNDEKVAGGPILAYLFYDEGTRRIYIIDCSVFAPSDVKIPYLDQLDVMAHTFETILEIQRQEAGG